MTTYKIGSADWYMNVDFPEKLKDFSDELNGKRGDFWARETKKRIEFIMNSKYIVEENGALRWASNGNYVDSEVCALMVLGGVCFSVYNTLKAREEQVDQQLSEYRERMRNYQPSAEELFEMRAAFGEGEKVVNVITGKDIQL